MAKVYDPILCMMVEEKVSTKDAGKIRGFFVSQLGKEFHKDFENSDKMMEFARSAKSVGTKFIGATSVNDSDECPEGMTCDAKFKVEYSEYPGSKKNITYVNAKTETEAANAVKGVVYNVIRISDKRSIDEAIRMCDKDVSFPSEKEAIEYCKENGIDPHKIKTIGDKYVVSE